MAQESGKVIFNRRFIGLSSILLLAMVGFTIYFAVQDGIDFGLRYGTIAIGCTLVALYGGSWLAGRRQLSRIVLDGDALVVRRVHFLDRGEQLRLPLAEITGWKVTTRRFKKMAYSDIVFEHQGRRFSFYLSDEARPDMEAIEALIPKDAWRS